MSSESNRHISEAVKQRRKEIKEEAKRLSGVILSHPFFPHDIHISMAGVKEWLNQPHKYYAEKNEALLLLPELLEQSEYLGPMPDPKHRDYILTGHIFKTQIAGNDSWIIVTETTWGECMVHSVSDYYPYIKEEQNL
jgi:hypothetical protein